MQKLNSTFKIKVLNEAEKHYNQPHHNKENFDEKVFSSFNNSLTKVSTILV